MRINQSFMIENNRCFQKGNMALKDFTIQTSPTNLEKKASMLSKLIIITMKL